jgi:uncharacterized membrane protein YqiK
LKDRHAAIDLFNQGFLPGAAFIGSVMYAEGLDDGLPPHSAEQGALAAARAAEAEAKRIKQVGDAEAGVIESKGKATAEAYRLGGEALTPAGLTAVEMVKAITAAGLKITPDVQVTGSGENGGGGLVQLLLADLVKRSQSTAPAVAQK